MGGSSGGLEPAYQKRGSMRERVRRMGGWGEGEMEGQSVARDSVA